MAFFSGDNYWENQPKPPSPTVGPAQTLVQQIRAKGGQPSQQQIDAAMEEYYQMEEAAPPKPGLQGINRSGPTPFDPQVNTDYSSGLDSIKGLLGGDYAMLKARQNPVDIGAFQPVMQGIHDMLGDLEPLADAGGIGNLIKGIAGAGFGAAQEVMSNDPMSIYEQLRNATPGYSYSGPSAEQMAKQQFDPLFQMLSQQAAQDKTQYEGQRERAKQAYAGFINDLLASKQTNANTYAQAGADMGKNYDAASKSVSDNANRVSQSLSKELAMLGIQEGADTLFKENQANVSSELGRLGQQRQTATNLNTQLGANAAAFDQQSVDTGRQAGLNYQGDLFDRYMDMMNQNDQQRLQLQGQQGQAQNQYSMQIAELLQKASSDRDTAINNQFQSIMDQQYRNKQIGIDQARLDLDATKAGIGVNGQDTGNAYQILQSDAKRYFGNDADAAEASQVLLNALRSAPQARDVGTLLAQIPDEELRKPFMADLAFNFFNKVINNKGM